MDDEYREHEKRVEEKTKELIQAWQERNSSDPETRQLWRDALERLHEVGRDFADYLNRRERGTG